MEISNVFFYNSIKLSTAISDYMNSIALTTLPVEYSIYDTWEVDCKLNISYLIITLVTYLCLTSCSSQCMHWGLEWFQVCMGADRGNLLLTLTFAYS